MRIFLLYLLLVFPAAFIGFQPFAAPRITYQHDIAANNARNIMLGIITGDEYGDPSQRLADEIVDRWLAGNMTKAELTEYGLDQLPPLDPWGRRYRFLRDANLPYEVGVYSLGRDGVTESNGNDPDDLNSWDPSSRDFYVREIYAEDRLRFFRRGTYRTLFIYLGLAGAVWLFRRLSRSQSNRVAEAVSAPSPHTNKHLP